MTSEVRILLPPQKQKKIMLIVQDTSGSSSFGRAKAFQALGGGFEPRLPLEKCRCSSVVEHFLGKEGVTSSTLVNGSNLNSQI